MKKILLVVLFLCVIWTPQVCAYEFDDWTDDEAVNQSDDADEESVYGIVNMSHEFLDDDILKISVYANDMIVPVLGLAFHLDYEHEKVVFLRYDPGKFLEIGGDPFYLVQNSDVSHEIIFGETLRRDDGFPVGGELIVDLYFQIINDDVFAFEFSDGVVSTLDTVRQDIDKIVWENLHVDKLDTVKAIDVYSVSTQGYDFVKSLKNYAPHLISLSAVLFTGLIILILKKYNLASLNR